MELGPGLKNSDMLQSAIYEWKERKELCLNVTGKSTCKRNCSVVELKC